MCNVARTLCHSSNDVRTKEELFMLLWAAPEGAFFYAYWSNEPDPDNRQYSLHRKLPGGRWLAISSDDLVYRNDMSFAPKVLADNFYEDTWVLM